MNVVKKLTNAHKELETINEHRIVGSYLELLDAKTKNRIQLLKYTDKNGVYVYERGVGSLIDPETGDLVIYVDYVNSPTSTIGIQNTGWKYSTSVTEADPVTGKQHLFGPKVVDVFTDHQLIHFLHENGMEDLPSIMRWSQQQLLDIDGIGKVRLAKINVVIDKYK